MHHAPAFIAPIRLRVFPTSRHDATRQRRPVALSRPPNQKPSQVFDTEGKPQQPRAAKQPEPAPNVDSPDTVEPADPADPLARLSRATGFEIIAHDVAQLTAFLHSFVKPKAPSPLSDDAQPDADAAHAETDASSSAPSPPPPYAPRSATAAKIASDYAATMGALDRSLQTLSVRARNLLSTVARAAGSAASTLLAVGCDALPILRRIDAGASARDGWSPLAVFDWQLGGAADADLDERRRRRVEYVARFLRGDAVGSAVGGMVVGISGIAKVVERVAPAILEGVVAVGKAGVAELGQAGRLPSRASTRVPRQTALQDTVSRGRRHEAGSASSKQRREVGVGVFAEDDAASQKVEGNDATGVIAPGVAVAIIPTVADDEVIGTAGYTAAKPAARPVKRPRAREADIVPTEVEPAIVKDSMQGSSQPRDDKRKSLAHLKGGAAVLGAGALASAAAGISITTAVSCSALLVSSVALTGAKAANASETHTRARQMFRQSRAVQNLEGFVVKASTARASRKLERPNLPLLQPAPERAETASQLVEQSVSDQTAKRQASSATTIDTPAYSLSGAQPRILSVPVVGFLLNWLDVVAYHAESFLATVLRRTGLHDGVEEDKSNGGWVLLRSFTRQGKRR